MDLNDYLVKTFAKTVNNTTEKETKLYYGTITRVETVGDSRIPYVHLDGSDANSETPLVEGTEVMVDDRVIVTIENHKAIVMSNITSPASARTAKNYMDLSEEDEGLVIGALNDENNNYNVLIKSDGVYVRDGDDVLAVYGGDGTQLYSDGELAAEFTPEGIRFFSDLDGYARDDLTNVNNGWLSSGIIIAGSIGELEIADDAISTIKIKDGAISTAKIGQAAITTAKIHDAAITNAKIEDAAITNAKIGQAAITTAKIEDGAITNAKIGQAAITTAKIEDGAITNAKIGQAAVTTAKIEDGAITNAKIGQAAITTAKIEDGAITNAKIGNAAITEAKIDDAAITTAKIHDAAVTNAKIGSAAVGTANIQNAAITTALIANEAVTNSQILSVSANKLTAGTIDANEINVANLRAKNLIVEKMNGQPILGGYELVNKNSTGYSGKNPSNEGWYEYQNGSFVASTDTTVNEDKAYYKDGNQVALYDQAYIDGLELGLQQQIDGAVETFTGTAVPTLVNYPAVDWTSAQMASHVGDIYYVVNTASNENGYCYRFAYDNTTSSYKWILIKDSDVTKALSDISDLQTFESTTTSWINETDDGLETIRQNHTSLSGVVNKTVKESIQLWFTKSDANTTPTAPNSTTYPNGVSDTSTAGNGWRTVVPTYNASYPYYFYCWQYKFVDNTYGWSAIIYDQATTEAEERARTGVANAATADGKAVTAQNTANANIKSSVMLWFTKANSTAPSKPTSAVTNNNPTGTDSYNKWNLSVPVYNSSYPHYFYCYQQQKGDGTYQWTDVVYDQATTETQNTARATSSSLANYVTTNDAAIQALQNQIDEQLDIWYGTVAPTTSNTPASEWSSTTDKDSHIGDMYYDTVTGKVYQWTKSGSTYSWTEIPDSSAAAALAAAQDAQATADGKRRVFISQPTVPYDVGDLWVNGDEVKYATVKRETGSYTASDWAQTATDDTVANANIKSSVQLWRTKSSSTAISKPYTDGSTSYIDSTTTNGDTWTTVVPVYNASYPYYHYCYQQQRGDGKYQWTTPVYDDATSIAMKKAQEALPASTFNTFESTTFKNVKDTVDEQSSTITTLTTTVSNKADSSTVTTLSNTVNSVSQTATSNSSILSQLTTTLGTNADGTTKTDDIMHRMSSQEQDLNGFKTTVSQTYTTKTEFNNLEIGGRNLTRRPNSDGGTSNGLTWSYDEETGYFTITGTNTKTDANYGFIFFSKSQGSLKVFVGETYTLTIEGNLPSDAYVQINGKNTSNTEYSLVSVTGTGDTISRTFVVPETHNEAVALGSHFVGIKRTAGTINCSFRIKLEKGNKATDWTPAPEDIEYRLSSAESSITQTANSIISLVANTDTYTKPDGTTATNTIKSAIKQNADNIALRVEKTGVISAINLTSETAKIQAGKVEIDGTAVFNAISSDVDDAITGKGYQTSSQVESAITGKGYQTASQVSTAISNTSVSDLADGSTYAKKSDALGSVITKDQYYLSTSSSSATGGSWQDTVPTWSANKYIWTRVATTKTPVSGTASTTYSTAVYDSALTSALSTASSAQSSANSAASSVVTTKQYYLSTSDSSATGGSWQDSVPSWASGKYIWVRFKIVKTPVSGSATTSYSPSENGVYDSTVTTALSTAYTANAGLTDKADKSVAVAETQRIYYRSSAVSSGVPVKPNGNGLPTSWVTDTVDKYNSTATASTTSTTGWTRKITPISNGTGSSVTKYLYLWTCIQKKTVSGTVTYDDILLDDSTTVIDGGKIITGSVTASQLATNAIQSLNYTAPTVNGTAPYSVDGTLLDLSNGNIITPNFMLDSVNGNAYLNGHIETESGHIGGFTITDDSIYHNMSSTSQIDLTGNSNIQNTEPYVLDENDYLNGGYASQYGVFVGLDGISCGFGKFSVDSDGDLHSTSGDIGGWEINADSLSRTDVPSGAISQSVSLDNDGLDFNATYSAYTTDTMYTAYGMSSTNHFTQDQTSSSVDISPGRINLTFYDDNDDPTSVTMIDEGSIELFKDSTSYIMLTSTDMISFRSQANEDRGIYDDTYSEWILWKSASNNVLLNGSSICLLQNGTLAIHLVLDSSDGNLKFRPATDSLNGDIFLGSPTRAWYCGWFQVAPQTTSDLKVKSVIKDFDWNVDKFIYGLKPIAFKRIKEDGSISKRVSLGFGAQDVAKLAKDLDIGDLNLYSATIIDENEDGEIVEKDYHGEEIDDSKLSWGLRYEEFIAPMVLEIQRLMDRVDALEAELAELKNK